LVGVINIVNNNLVLQAHAIFKHRFIEFGPYNNVCPSAWETLTLADVAEMSAGGDKPSVLSERKSDECPYPIYSNGLNLDGLYGYTNIPKITKESVTVSARGTIGFVCLRHIPYVPIVRLISLVPYENKVSAKYLYLWLCQLNISGTGTTQQQLTVPDFRKTRILVPTLDVVNEFTDTINPLFEGIRTNQIENEQLIETRNTLLPKLMSGELDVSTINF